MSKNKLSPNVYGIETEYSCMITLPGNVVHELVGSCHSLDAELGLYEEPDNKGTSEIPNSAVIDALAKQNIYRTEWGGMLSNGGRFYFDPSGPEYATPETSTAEEAVHRTFDGDEIVLGLFAELRNTDVIEGYQFNRRVTDHNRSSRGIHLNTSTTLGSKNKVPNAINHIAALNVVKGAIFGSGGLLLDEEGHTQFHHSPRLSITSHTASQYANYKNRPLVRVPFKPDGKHLSRIETVTSDALSFGWPLRASLVSTNALVGIIEMRQGKGLPVLKDPIGAAKEVGRLGNDCLVDVVEGDKTVQRKPLEIMRNICELILEVDSIEAHLDDESDQVLGEIIEVADKMSQDMSSVVGQVESVTRLTAMKRKMKKEGIDLDAERMCRFDYAWDLIGGGIAEGFRKKNLAGWQGFDADYSRIKTSKRKQNPPTDTRAFARGNSIKNDKGANDSTWDQIDFGHIDQLTDYLHPLATEKPKLWTPNSQS